MFVLILLEKLMSPALWPYPVTRVILPDQTGVLRPVMCCLECKADEFIIRVIGQDLINGGL